MPRMPNIVFSEFLRRVITNILNYTFRDGADDIRYALLVCEPGITRFSDIIIMSICKTLYMFFVNMHDVSVLFCQKRKPNCCQY